MRIPLVALVVATSAVGSTLPSPSAHAFGEDLCYLKKGGLAQCVPLAKGCKVGEYRPRCAAGSLAASLAMAPKRTSGRSMIHTDATYLMARLAGFDEPSAYWIAAYDQATDLGRFVPADRTGKLLADPDKCPSGVSNGPETACERMTAKIDGLRRENIITGGTLYHFHAPFHEGIKSPIAGIDGLHPNLDGPRDQELFLEHLRHWAMGQGVACTGGFTDAEGGSFATGPGCFRGGTGKIVGALAALGPIKFPLVLTPGLQVIVPGKKPVTSDGFDAYVGKARAPFARIGIYLHALQDRVSHHVCTDQSYAAGPMKDGPMFVIDMTSKECSQPLHFLRHAFEVGIPQGELAPADRTMSAGLAVTFDAVQAFAKLRGVTPPTAAPARDELLSGLEGVLAIADPVARQDAMIALGCARGIAPLWGLGACPAKP